MIFKKYVFLCTTQWLLICTPFIAYEHTFMQHSVMFCIITPHPPLLFHTLMLIDSDWTGFPNTRNSTFCYCIWVITYYLNPQTDKLPCLVPMSKSNITMLSIQSLNVIFYLSFIVLFLRLLWWIVITLQSYICLEILFDIKHQAH